MHKPELPRLSLLGPPTLHLGAQRWLLERKDAALLCRLALASQLARSELALQLWPDATPALARTSLRQRLYRLRRNTGCDIASGAQTLALAAGLEHDLQDPLPTLRADPDALAGELLAGCSYGDAETLETWLAETRASWNRRRAEALAALAEEHEAAGHLALALRYAQRLLQQDVLFEHAQRRVMRLHYRRGDRAAALAAYEQCRVVLAEQLGTAPAPETQALAELAASAGTELALAPLPVCTLRPPRLVGREPERAALRAALEGGCVAVVVGEAGIGKTRLLEDLAAALPGCLASGARAGDARLPYALLARLVRAGQTWLQAARAAPAARPETAAEPAASNAPASAPASASASASAAASQNTPALEPWVRETLAALLPEWGPAPLRLDELRLHQALSQLLMLWLAGGLQTIVIDDLHHADPASVQALLALLGAPAGPGWLLGVRTAELPPDFKAWCDSAEPGCVRTCTLHPLELAGVQALLKSLNLPGLDAAAWAGPLLAHSGGNPLFMLETLRAAVATPGGLQGPLPMPSAIGALIDARLARLSNAAMRLARVAALAGQNFSAALAAEVLGCHPVDIVEPWAELERALVMRDDAFAHDLIADGVQRGVPQAVARLLHARLADVLVQQGAAPAAVAHHRAGAEQWPAAGQAYVAAGAVAQAASRRADECELREQAALCFERGQRAPAAFDARCDNVEPTLIVRGSEAALALTAQLLQNAADAHERARALAARAHTELMSGDAAHGLASARQALELAQAVGDERTGLVASRLLAIGLAQAGRADEALATLQPLQRRADAGADVNERLGYWADYAYVLNQAGQLRRTVHALEQAITLAQQLCDHAELATLTANLATAEGNLGHSARALQHARAARALTDPIGRTDGTAGGMISMTLAQYCVPLGRFAEAVEGLERAVAFFDADGQALWATLARNHLARCWLDLGQRARALQVLSVPGADALGVPHVMARRLTMLGRCRRVLGHAEPAELGQALALLGERGHAQSTMLARLENAAAPSANNPHSAHAAAEACAEVARWACQLEYLGVVTTAQVLEARARLAAGENAAARALALAALAHMAEHDPTDLSLPEAWWTLHQVLLASAEHKRADAVLLRARDWLLQTALPEVPEPFRASFLQRNPVHRALLAAARERLPLLPHLPSGPA